MSWKPLPIAAKLIQNLDEDMLRGGSARLENAYVNDDGGLSRFPVLRPLLTLPGASGPVYVGERIRDLIAVCGGRTYRVDTDRLLPEDYTGAVLNGDGRPVFAETDQGDLVMAAGGPLITLKSNLTELLSKEAPEATHVAWKDGYLLANETGSNRFRFTEAGKYGSWPALNVLSAESKPDNLTGLYITDYGDLLLLGDESVEQWDSTVSGKAPFTRRFNLGAGVLSPYAVTSSGGRTRGMTDGKQYSELSAGSSRSESEDLQARLESITDFTGMWSESIKILGQRFDIVQFPNEENAYGTKGLTLLLDTRKRRWSQLFGWDAKRGVPTAWQGRSYVEVNGRHFVGGDAGQIYELVDARQGSGVESDVQRVCFRTGVLMEGGVRDITISRLMLRMKRGTAPLGNKPPLISLRVNKNNRGFGQWIRRPLGATGDRDMRIQFNSLGSASSWQLELEMTDAGDFQLLSMEANTESRVA